MKNMFPRLQKVVIAFAFAFLLSCSSEKVATQPEAPVVIEKVSPGPGYIWYGPEWKWDGVKKEYVYAPGEWVQRPSGVWVRGHWKPVKGGWRWVPGHWQ